MARDQRWPELHLSNWRTTRDTLHLWTQIAGKIRLVLTPRSNHWWNVPLYLSVRGLTTSPIPYRDGQFEMEFDFTRHQLSIATTWNGSRQIALEPQSVAEFHRRTMQALHALGIDVRIYTRPVEVPGAIPFPQDEQHHDYDPEYAQRFWRVLLSSTEVLHEFRCRYLGKVSPIHFFWGSFDLAVTRFSGRRAPEIPNADAITREAYSHEVSSAGFWPGGVSATGLELGDAAFYVNMAPTPPGFGDQKVLPAQAFFDRNFGEFLLMYEDVRTSPAPERTLMEFLQTTYAAGANLAGWNREELEVRSEAQHAA